MDDLTTQENSLRDELAANLAAVDPISTSEPDLAPEPSKEGSAAPVAETEEQKGRTANRLRDDKGRLLPGKNEAPQQTTLATNPEVAAVASPKRPSTWKKETWPIYDKLAVGQPLTADEAKQIVDTIHQREGDYAKGVSTYKNEWDQAKPLIDAVAPYIEKLQQHNIQPDQMISRLFAAHERLSLGSAQEKISMFQSLLPSYGIKARLAVQDNQGNWQLLNEQAPQPQQFSPQDIDRIVDQKLQSASIKQSVQQFEADAAEKYPHYAAVKQDMAGLLQAGLANDLPSAYSAAVRLPQHSDIFDTLQQQQRDQETAKQKEQRQATVRRARSNVTSVPSSTTVGEIRSPGEKGLREELTENLRAISSGRV